jgi:hypothetical protein
MLAFDSVVGLHLGRASSEKSLNRNSSVNPTARLVTPIARYAFGGEQKSMSLVSPLPQFLPKVGS